MEMMAMIINSGINTGMYKHKHIRHKPFKVENKM